MAQLTRAEAIAQNQQMIKEWAEECEADGHMAFYMAVISEKGSFNIFRSEGMDDGMLIRNLEIILATTKKNKK